jgi:hypothetical protein
MGKASKKTLFKLHYNESAVDSQVDLFFYDIAERMKDQGILISIDGPLYNVIKIKPPLVFKKPMRINILIRLIKSWVIFNSLIK